MAAVLSWYDFSPFTSDSIRINSRHKYKKENSWSFKATDINRRWLEQSFWYLLVKKWRSIDAEEEGFYGISIQEGAEKWSLSCKSQTEVEKINGNIVAI